MISWNLTTALDTGDLHTTGTATDLAAAAAALTAATTDAILTAESNQLPVFTLTLDDENIAMIFTGQRPDGAANRHRSLDHLATITTTIVGRGRAEANEVAGG